MIKLAPVFLAFLVLVPVTAPAKNLACLYDRQTLEYWQLRYSQSTNRILGVMLTVFTPPETRDLARVNLRFPLVGEINAGPLEFYGASNPPTVTMPVLSIKFLDDLCTAFAWLWANGHSLEAIPDYMAALKYNTEEKFPRRRYPTPLDALHIPQNALEDSRVDDLALRLFNSARAFILAHQLGHLYRGHSDFAVGVRREEAVQQEVEADSFALDIMRRTSTIPMGVMVYLMAATHWWPNRADFENDDEWGNFLENHAVHPLTAQRLTSLAKQLQSDAEGYRSNAKEQAATAQTIRFLAMIISEQATIAGDVTIQQSIAANAVMADLTPRFSRSPMQSSEELPSLLAGPSTQEPNTGVFVFGVPTSMLVGQTQGLHLRLIPTTRASDTNRPPAAEENVITDQVRLSKRMEVSLSATGLRVTAITPQIQAISSSDVTEWKWDLEPMQPGLQRVHLTMNIIANVEGSDLPRTIRTIDREVVIHISWFKRMSRFAGEHWQWLWAAIVIPLGTLAWSYVRRMLRDGGEEQRDR